MIPTFNQSIFIREAIDSALAQTYQNIEVIVGDDASTDMTGEIVRSIKDLRLKYIRNKNNIGRVSNYRNLLYNHASGDYVVNLDGDDYYTDLDFIKDAVELAKEKATVLIVTARTTRKSITSESFSEVPRIRTLTGMQILRKLPNRRYLFQHMATLYHRNTALAIDFYRSSSISSDWESLYRLSILGEVKYLDRNIGVWRIHKSNATGAASSKEILENQLIWIAIYNDAINNGMNYFIASYKTAKCIAYSAQSAYPSISKNGNASLTNFLLGIFYTCKLSVLITLMSPKYMIRLMISYFGYYRDENIV